MTSQRVVPEVRLRYQDYTRTLLAVTQCIQNQKLTLTLVVSERT